MLHSSISSLHMSHNTPSDKVSLKPLGIVLHTLSGWTFLLPAGQVLLVCVLWHKINWPKMAAA